MLAILTSWVVTTFIFLSIGSLAIYLYNRILKQDAKYTSVDIFLLGLVFSSALIGFNSLWLPSGFYTLIGLIGICCIYWIYRREHLFALTQSFKKTIKDLPTSHLIILSLPLIIFAIHCLTAPLWVDVSYYHIQNIMWIDEYSVVPGLANLQPRFGFNSSYYLLCSVFGFKPLFGQYILVTHTLCLVYIGTWLLYRVLKGVSFTKSIIPITLFCCLVLVYRHHIASSSSDLLPNLLITYLFIKILMDKDAIKKYPLVFICIPIVCLTLKLSAFVVCLFTAYILFNYIKDKQYKELFNAIVIGFIIIAPWMIRTIVMTGYLVFPFPSIDIFSFDWKVPIEYVTEQKDYIHAFARADKYPAEEALSLSITQWIPLWWKSGMFYYNDLVNRVFFILMLATIPCVAGISAFSRRIKVQYSILLWSWVITFLGVIFWFFSAPDFRFGYGFILPLIFIPAFILIDNIFTKVSIKEKFPEHSITIFVSIFIILFLTLQSIRWTYYKLDKEEPLYTLLIKPQWVTYNKDIREKYLGREINFTELTINNMTIYTPTIETHCYDCPLPCSGDYTGGLEMRGESMQEGFRCKPNAPYHRGY